MYRLSIVSLAASVLVLGCSTAPEYVFRSDDRPGYGRTVSIEELAAANAAANLVLLDVRLLEDYEADPVLIPGARYRNPEAIEQWSSAIPKSAKVVVYCVKGRWVSQKAANYLDRKGFEVYSLSGGIEAWKASGEQ